MSRLFGTNGVRGVVGKTLTPELALRLGRAVGSGLEPGSTVAVGRDARTSGPMFLQAFCAGLHSTGVHTVDHGILPTPALQYMVKTGTFQAGAIITASHNPPEYNGIKLVAPDGTETSRDEEEKVERIHFANRFRSVAWDRVGTATAVDDAIDRYVAGILQHVDVEAIKKAKLKAVLDAGGGAGGPAGVKLLKKLGVKATFLACDYDGSFSSRPSEPVEANAASIKAAVLENGADVGFLLDGDADRAVFI
ncbi:MAG TPA: phosphoglucosamine mutase, partial [Candidatus Thermoplasmatota archaeon]|nr:phosphoglucosamine mutase [Candidatus Thermoplasmatota archaeon]